ncbi:hypothetical protein FRB93_011386 [Tulasnella sp. JGI-2019a]|nr:hypothetical protein FRB93_011386 [Tulasnella sp. JGI-2019a]
MLRTSLLGAVSLALLSLLCPVVRADETPTCTTTRGESVYDLSPLSRQHDHTITSNGINYTLTVCRAVTSETWNLDADAVGGFWRAGHGDLSMGKFNSTPVILNDQPYIFMRDGSQCTKGVDQYASTAIRFVCDAAVEEGTPQLVARLPPDGDPCSFFFEWRTKYACPGTKQAGASGFIAVFSAILFVAFLAYVFGGLLYNRYVLGLRGQDQIPPISCIPLSTSLSSFQNIIYAIQDKWDSWRSNSSGYGGGGSGKQWGSWRGGQRDGFSRLPREEEEAMMDGRLSFEAEEEDDGPVLYNDIHRQQVNGPGSVSMPVPVTNGGAGKVSGS